MRETFLIEPLNEGQPLNYEETFSGTFEEAKDRADEIKNKLQSIFYQGIIEVQILNKEAKVIWRTQ